MAKNLLQDIVPPDRRSIRNIPVPNRKKAKFDDVNNREPETRWEDESLPKIYPYEDGPKNEIASKYSRKGIWLGAVLAVLIVVFAIASIFAQATIIIEPVTKIVSVGNSNVWTAKRTAVSGELGFDLLKLTKIAGMNVPANGEERVERKASGTIVIYNNADTLSQRLIKNTRFETPEGLIYRVNESVVIPGKSGQDGAAVPGSLEVMVYADDAGEKYNIGKTDFTIPGFKTDSLRYKEIYARSKTDMTGGFAGNVKKVSDEDLAKAKAELHSTIQSELMTEAKSKVPNGFILYDDATLFEYKSLQQTDETGSSVKVNEEGTIYAMFFQRNALSAALASSLASELSENSLEIFEPEKIKFNLLNKEKLSPVALDEIKFTLEGEIVLIGKLDESKIRNEVAGKPKSSLQSVLSNYPDIESADSVIRPFWKRNFPDDTDKIAVRIKLPTR